MTSWHSLPMEVKCLILQQCISSTLRPQQYPSDGSHGSFWTAIDAEHDAAKGLIDIIKAAPELMYELSRVIHLRRRTAGIAHAHESEVPLWPEGRVMSKAQQQSAREAQYRRLEPWSFEIRVCDEVLRLWKEMMQGHEAIIPSWMKSYF